LKREAKDATGLLEEMRGVAEKIKDLDETLKTIEEKQRTSSSIFRISSSSVPVGKDETENAVLRTWENTDLGFPALNHWILPRYTRSSTLTGRRRSQGAIFAHERCGARLERALMNFMLDRTLREGIPRYFHRFSSTARA